MTREGNTVTLLTKTNGTFTDAKSYGTLKDGISIDYDMSVYRDGNSILFSIGDAHTPPTPEPIDDSNNTKNIYEIRTADIFGGNTDTGNAQNNTVNIYGGTSFTNIYGGYAPNGLINGNTLNIRNKNISTQNIYNFSNLNFYIPKDAINGDTMLTLTDKSGTNLSAVNIRAGVMAGNTNLQIGDTINLLTNSNGLTTNYLTT